MCVRRQGAARTYVILQQIVHGGLRQVLALNKLVLSHADLLLSDVRAWVCAHTAQSKVSLHVGLVLSCLYNIS